MEIKASLKYYRMAPRKLRLVVDLIRGKKVNEAKSVLGFSSKRAAQPILKLLNSAIANAKKNFEVKDNEINDFYIKKITVDEGAKLKRWRPVSRGAAHEIQKKTSHVNLVLAKEKKETKKEIAKKIKTKKTSINKKPKKS
jgi:large subunit ribosomal protein L22